MHNDLHRLRSNLAATVLGAGLLVAGSFGKPAAAKHANPIPHAAAPVVVELFTSEGCSDCPPADAVLADLARMSPAPGVPVIALEEHVDYWNSDKWRDPFSSAAISARQNEYAAAFHHDEVYTPEMVVDGAAEFVGSQEDVARAAIVRAARAPKALVSVVVVGGDAVEVSASHLPDGVAAADVFVAVTEDGLSSRVTGGENAGHRLEHGAVVRRLERIGELAPGGSFRGQVTVGASAFGARRRVAAFVQDRATRHIVGAASTDR